MNDHIITILPYIPKMTAKILVNLNSRNLFLRFIILNTKYYYLNSDILYTQQYNQKERKRESYSKIIWSISSLIDFKYVN